MPTLKEAAEEIIGTALGLSSEELFKRKDTFGLIDTITRRSDSRVVTHIERITFLYDTLRVGSIDTRVLGLLHTQFLPTRTKRQLLSLEAKYRLPGKLLGTWDFGYSLSDENLDKASKDPLYHR